MIKKVPSEIVFKDLYSYIMNDLKHRKDYEFLLNYKLSNITGGIDPTKAINKTIGDLIKRSWVVLFSRYVFPKATAFNIDLDFDIPKLVRAALCWLAVIAALNEISGKLPEQIDFGNGNIGELEHRMQLWQTAYELIFKCKYRISGTAGNNNIDKSIEIGINPKDLTDDVGDILYDIKTISLSNIMLEVAISKAASRAPFRDYKKFKLPSSELTLDKFKSMVREVL